MRPDKESTELTEDFAKTATPGDGKTKAVFRDNLVQNLALQVTCTPNPDPKLTTYSRAYVFVYKGREKITSITGIDYFPKKWMGLGSVHEVSLEDARSKAREYREQLLAGVDPFLYRDARNPVAHTLRVVARLYYEESSEPNKARWWMQLEQYVFADRRSLGDRPIKQIKPSDACKALAPIFMAAPKNANRIRARLEKIWNFAKKLKWTSGDNPFGKQALGAGTKPRRKVAP